MQGPPLGRRLLLGGAAGAALGLTGCARGTLTRPAPEGVVTLNNDNATWATGYTAASDVLEQRIGLRMSARAIPNTSNYQQVVRMSAQTDSTTDLIKWWNGYRLTDIARSGLLTPLDDAWDRAEAQGWVSPGLRDDFTVEGHTYGVPLYKSYFAAFYSRAALDRVGAEPPTTFEDLLSLCAELREDGVTPIGAGGASSWESLIWFQQLLGGTDPDFYTDVTDGRAAYTDAPAVEAMQVWSRMYAEGCFSAPDFDSSSAPARLRDGDLGLMLAGTWQANAFGEAGVGSDDVGLFLVPPTAPGVEQVAVVESGAFAVPVNAHKHDEALAVVGEWLATDVQQAWVDFLGDTSANPDALPTGSVVQSFAEETVAAAPRPLIRYWEASPPILIEGNVQDLSGFMVDPSERNATATLESMQSRAVAEWRAWENS